MTLAALVGQLLLGWLLADLLTGLVHWWEDRLAREDMPLVGRWIVAPNRMHHVAPLLFAESSLLKRNLGIWLLTGLVSGVWLLLGGFSAFWAAATLGALVSGEVHRLAHVPAEAGGVIRVLQQVGLVQSPRHHAGHHRAPSDSRYCVLTDWLNPALDGLKVWAWLEAGLSRVGLRPNRGTL